MSERVAVMLVEVDDRYALAPDGPQLLAMPFYLIVSLFAQMDVSRNSHGYKCLYPVSSTEFPFVQ